MAHEQISQFAIDLYPIADVGEETQYRLRNTPGEIQRPTVLEKSHKDLSVQGDLISVVHGFYDEEGEAATLVVFQFRFLGSQIQRRRFRSAKIIISFGNGTSLGDILDPEVVCIAPDGEFIIDAASREVESAISGNLSATLGPFGAVGFGVGLGWERRTTTRKAGQSTLFGCRKTVERDYGKKNAAVWTLKENKITGGGIPSFISTAILLKPQTAEDFQAIVTVDASADPLFSASTMARRLFGQLTVDPIHFSQMRAVMGPAIPNLDKNNLAAATKLLHELGSVKVGSILVTFHET